MNRTIATLLGVLALASTTAIALAPAAAAAPTEATNTSPDGPAATSADPGCWYVNVREKTVGPVSARVVMCDVQVTVNESWNPSTTGTQEHCWSLGAEAGPATAVYNPCGTETDVDTSPDSDDDDVTVHRGYDETTVVEVPGDPFGNGSEDLDS